MTIVRIIFCSFLLLALQPRTAAQGTGIRIDCTDTLQLNQGTTGQFAQIFVPDYYQVPPDGRIVLVVHLHSASWAAEDAVYRSRANAILFNVHLGALSSPYQSFFAAPSRFQTILDCVASALASRGIVASPAVKTLILSSFSAGYAGVREILKNQASYQRIDALTLADGLHASSDSLSMNAQMADFLRFSRDARDRKKVFLLTHSSIATTGYQSTTQTSEYLLNALGIVRRSLSTFDEIGEMYSACDTGAFHVRGYHGETASDHMKHLYGMHRMISDAADILASRASEEGEAIIPASRPLRGIRIPSIEGRLSDTPRLSQARFASRCSTRACGISQTWTEAGREAREYSFSRAPSQLASWQYVLRLSTASLPGLPRGGGLEYTLAVLT